MNPPARSRLRCNSGLPSCCSMSICQAKVAAISRARPRWIRAFETIEVFAPDLILLDLAMPGLSGFEILNALRADRQNEQIPVLVLTGDAFSKNKRRALAAGATDLLVKPFDPSEVSMRIRNLLQARFLQLEIQEQNHLLEERVRERTCQLEAALADLHAAQRHAMQQERLSAFGEMAGGVVH